MTLERTLGLILCAIEMFSWQDVRRRVMKQLFGSWDARVDGEKEAKYATSIEL